VPVSFYLLGTISSYNHFAPQIFSWLRPWWLIFGGNQQDNHTFINGFFKECDKNFPGPIKTSLRIESDNAILVTVTTTLVSCGKLANYYFLLKD